MALVLLWRKPIDQRFVSIPGGAFILGSPEGGTRSPRRTAELAPYRLQATEVTVRCFVDFLNAVRPDPPFESPQIAFDAGRYRPVMDVRMPVTHVSYGEALRYGEWYSERNRVRARLPTPDEWEAAARGGVRKARFPWGWGEPAGRAHFAATGPVRVARQPPNRYGLYDMAGNVAEWCQADASADTAPALGGSWAERDPDLLRVFHRVEFPESYRDADVGFRVLIE